MKSFVRLLVEDDTYMYDVILLYLFGNVEKAFSFRGPKVWSELEYEVKLASSLSNFKCRLNNK